MKKLITILLFTIAINAQQLSKVYVLAEGGSSAGTAALSLLNNSTAAFTQNIFNPGSLGLYPDGMIMHENFLYVTEQGGFGGSGKVYKIDTLGNVVTSAVVGTNPYSLAIANNKVYITNGPASNVSVVKLNDFSAVKTITVGVYPQEIFSYNNKIYVANNSLWGGASDSTVTVIDALTDEKVATIVVKKNPASMAISNDGFLLIGCPGDGAAGKIFKVNISTNEIVGSYTIPGEGFGSDISVDKQSNNLFFISNNNNLVKYNTVTNEVAVVKSSVYPNNYYYGYKYDEISKKHFLLDAKSFTVNGALFVLDSTGTVVNTYNTGNAPKRVVLKYSSAPSSVVENQVPAQFNLNQNYPNPFNPSTKISFSLNEKEFVTLRVFDALGREVKTLVNEELNEGVYEVEFNAAGLAGGVYFYQLNGGNGTSSFSITKKMSLLK